MENEKIDLDNSTKITVEELAKAIKQDAPRFTFFMYEKGSDENLGKTELK